MSRIGSPDTAALQRGGMGQLGLAAIIVLLLSTSLGAQEKSPPSSEWWFGFQLFGMLFEQKGLTPLYDTQAALTDDPAQTVAIVMGQFPAASGLSTDLQEFLKKGGAVLLATDQTRSIRGVGFFHRGPLEVTSSADSYQGFPDCVRITDLDSTHPVTRGVQLLIANRCGWISRLSRSLGDWNILARVPADSRPVLSAKPLIAVMDLQGSTPGRLAVVADHSLFTNGMLWHGDNAILAINLCNWLCESGRTHLLFLTDGDLGTGPPPRPQLPEKIPPPDPNHLPDLSGRELIQFANKVVTGLEDSDVFNELATTRLPFISEPIYRRSLLLLLSALAGLFVLSRFSKADSERSPVPERRVMANVSQLRIQQHIATGEFHTPARQLARDLCIEITGSNDPQDWSFWSRDVNIMGNLFIRSRVRDDFARVMRTAMSDRRRVSRRQFRSLASRIQRLRKLHNQGRLTVDAE